MEGEREEEEEKSWDEKWKRERLQKFNGKEFAPFNHNTKLEAIGGTIEEYAVRKRESAETPVGFGVPSDIPVYPKTAFDCYFSPLSACAFDSQTRKEMVVLTDREWTQVISGDVTLSRHRVIGGLSLSTLIRINTQVIPKEFEQYGLLWYGAGVRGERMRDG